MKNDFQIRIISLLNQNERRQKMSSLFDNSDHQWRFFDAISGINIDPYLEHYDRPRRMKFPGHDLTKNEIACFISHREVWKECIESGTKFVVLEDDASVVRDGFDISYLKILIDAISPHLERDVVVRLGHGAYKNDYFRIGELCGDFSLVRYQRDPLCALAYVITPEVAQRLVSHSQKFFLPVDDYMWNGNESGCRVFDISPVYFSTPLENNPSTIGSRKKNKQSLLFKIKREIYRAIYLNGLRKNEKKITQGMVE